jgi:hypothetical protein
MSLRFDSIRAAAAAAQQRQAAADRARRAAADRAQRAAAEKARQGAQHVPCGFQNPFRGNGVTAPRGASSTPAVRNHIQTLGSADACDPWSRTARANDGSFSISMSTPEAPKEKKKSSNIFGPVVNFVEDKTPLDEVAEFGVDAAGKVVDVARVPVGFAVDRVGDVIDVAGDVLDITPADVGKALETAAKTGLKLGGFVLDEARKVMRNALNDGLQIENQIKKLDIGDTYSLGGSVSGGLVVDGGIGGDIEIKCTAEGFTVSAGANAHVGLGIGYGASVEAGVRTEFKFDNRKDAQKAALILAGASAAVAAPPPLKPALVPSPGDLNFLKDNRSAVEVSRGISAELDAKLEAGFVEAGVSAGAKVQTSYRMEFEDGKPSALVRSVNFSTSGEAKAALGLVKKFGGNVGGELTAALKGNAELTGNVTVETRIPLGSSGISDLDSLADRLDSAETSIKATVTADAGERGVQAEVGVYGLSIRETRRALSDLIRGRVGDAFDEVDVTATGSFSDFKDSGYDLGFDLKFGKVGVDANIYAERRDVRHKIEIGTD